MYKKTILPLLAVLFIGLPAQAQIPKLSGPRVGITGITPGLTQDAMKDDYGIKTPAVMQYGWQFEKQFMDGGEITGLVEWVLLLGGMEQGMVIPSLTSLVGLRHQNGFEAGLGPNFIMKELRPSFNVKDIGFVFAAGYNFRSGNLNLPVNISWVPSHQSPHETGKTGHRVSLMFGFNMRSDHAHMNRSKPIAAKKKSSTTPRKTPAQTMPGENINVY